MIELIELLEVIELLSITSIKLWGLLMNHSHIPFQSHIQCDDCLRNEDSYQWIVNTPQHTSQPVQMHFALTLVVLARVGSELLNQTMNCWTEPPQTAVWVQFLVHHKVFTEPVWTSLNCWTILLNRNSHYIVVGLGSICHYIHPQHPHWQHPQHTR